MKVIVSTARDTIVRHSTFF